MMTGKNIQGLGTAFRRLGAKILTPASELAGLQWGWKTRQPLMSPAYLFRSLPYCLFLLYIIYAGYFIPLFSASLWTSVPN